MFFVVFFVVIAGSFLLINSLYKNTAYYQVTKSSYLFTRYDKAKYGEYLIYKNLAYLENSGCKFLFNVYIPKANNKTTEIDVLMICSQGLFVFESKNYSGWIFGNEIQRSWTQTLPKGRGHSQKERFYNPIMQNASHIKYLHRVVNKNVPS